MKIDLSSNIQFLTHVGEKTAKKLNKLGIYTVRDLIFYYPRDYKDFSNIIQISDLRSQSYGENITIRGKIAQIANKRTSRRRFTVTEAIVEDETGSIKVVWFNQPFLVKMLSVGRELILNGKVSYNWYSKEVVMESPERTLKPCIVPVYPETEGITSKFLQKLIANCSSLIAKIEDWLPEELIQKSKFKNQNLGERSTLGLSINNKTIKQYNNGLMDIRSAIRELHFPISIESIKEAQRRMAFDELFTISLRSNLAKAEVAKESAPQIKVDTTTIAEFVKNLPFELTNDQRKATWQIIKDLEGENQKAKGKRQKLGEASSLGLVMPMNRLLNGDVGSGKTVVAAIAALATVQAGYRVILMCPTSILASQHYETFCKLFKNEKISIGLVTSERKECFLGSRAKSQEPSKLGPRDSAFEADISIGTHALLQGSRAKSQEPSKLGPRPSTLGPRPTGLVIIDEQHRFGVEQRSALLKAGSYKLKDGAIENDPLAISYQLSASAKKTRPHFLSMTATPIPRTLHLALFGDLDLSVIREKPKDRKEIKTRFVNANNRQKAYEFIRNQLHAGRQAFVICPLIEEKSEARNPKPETNTKSKIINNYGLLAIGNELLASDRKTVIEEAKKLQSIFPEYRIGMLHGRMPAKARSHLEGGKVSTKSKDEVMEQFSKGSINILVSTSVVEVGVDVPNASVMVIEDAERFGLAQIHQFRGRVGRAEHQSYCFLFSSTMSEKALKRLTSLEATSDGFRLAEIDLETRGPGAIFGTEQSGLLDLKMATLADRELIEEASQAAKALIENDPDLFQHPLLKDRIAEYLQNKHME